MADFDTAVKRAAGMGMTGLDPALLPIPDGTVAVQDRLHLLDIYNVAAVVPPTASDAFFHWRYRRKSWR